MRVVEHDLHGPQHVHRAQDSQVVLEAERLVAAPQVMHGGGDLGNATVSLGSFGLTCQ